MWRLSVLSSILAFISKAFPLNFSVGAIEILMGSIVEASFRRVGKELFENQNPEP